LRSIIEGYGSTCIFHKVDESILDGVRFGGRKPLPMVAYYRILLSSIIDDCIPKILYLDSDIVVVNNIVPIFGLEIDNYALAAVEDVPIADKYRMSLSLPYDAKYFNSGVMLINLNYWRKNNSENQLLSFAKRERKVYYYDQDAFNAVFRSQWFSLPRRWNKFSMCPIDNLTFHDWRDKYEYSKYPMIIHYDTPLKPWLNFPIMPYKRLYYKYLKITPWKDAKSTKCGNYIYVCRILFFYYLRFFLKRTHLYFLYHPIVGLKRRLEYSKSLKNDT
jgi:lipopolysaccharide biosynthesis glycosyltransferase